MLNIWVSHCTYPANLKSLPRPIVNNVFVPRLSNGRSLSLLLFHTTHEGLSDFTLDDYDLPWIYDLTMSSCEFLCCISFSYWVSSVLIHQASIAHHPAQHPQRKAHQHSRGGARPQHESQEATRRLGPRHPAHVAALHRRQRAPICLDSDYECLRPCPPLPRCDSPSSESDGSSPAPRARCRAGCPRRPRPRPRRRAATTTSRRSSRGRQSFGARAPSRSRSSSVPCRPYRPRRSLSPLPRRSQQEMSAKRKTTSTTPRKRAASSPSPRRCRHPSPSCESLPMSAALPSSRALRRESAIIPPSVSMASTKRASVRRSPAVRASIPIPTRAPPLPPIVTSHSHSHSYSLAVGPSPNTASVSASCYLSPTSASASASASRLSPASSRSRTRAPPKTPLPTDALSTPWSGDWTAYAPFGTPSPSSSQHLYDSNLAPPRFLRSAVKFNRCRVTDVQVM
ncbi:hypothetical protein DFH08DRAFT_517718 [Mycena albidolilacea]|uniref:Uncharacterized protein n=1 Tax=Mycena albidolilacea TaxID=1033008 RepID=A0AAD6Z3P1_9AGAR|nr:hypothetical protein DFH08DRAFT_517718 [Mycena albidolilacea]